MINLFTRALISEAEAALTSSKNVTTARIKKMEEVEIKASSMRKDVKTHELTTTKKIAEANQALNEFLVILTDDLNKYDPENRGEDDINIGRILTHMVNFVSNSIKDEEVALPAVQDGDRRDDEAMGEYLYQNEYDALSERVQKKFYEIGNWINVTNETFEAEKVLQERLQNYLDSEAENVSAERLEEERANLKKIQKALKTADKIIEHGDLWAFEKKKIPDGTKKKALKAEEMEAYKRSYKR